MLKIEPWEITSEFYNHFSGGRSRFPPPAASISIFLIRSMQNIFRLGFNTFFQVFFIFLFIFQTSSVSIACPIFTHLYFINVLICGFFQAVEILDLWKNSIWTNKMTFFFFSGKAADITWPFPNANFRLAFQNIYYQFEKKYSAYYDIYQLDFP